MSRQRLLSSAKELQQPNSVAIDEYAAIIEKATIKLNEHMMQKKNINDIVGKENLEMMKDNHANHGRFMLSIFKNYKPEVLLDTVLWVFRAYRSHGFNSTYWAAQLNAWIIILREMLTEESFKEIFPFYEWMQVNIPQFVIVSDERIDSFNSDH